MYAWTAARKEFMYTILSPRFISLLSSVPRSRGFFCACPETHRAVFTVSYNHCIDRSLPRAEPGYYRTSKALWEWTWRKSRRCLSKGLSEVVNLLSVPIFWACHYQSRTCTTDTHRIPYSIPIFLMSQSGELGFEYEFRNPAYWYWYALGVVGQDLFEL